MPERREIMKTAKSKPVEHNLPFSTWSLVKLADILIAEGVVDNMSHEGLRTLLRAEGVFLPTYKDLEDLTRPDYAATKARGKQLYAIADGEVIPEPGEPEVSFRVDEFGPLNLQPRPGRHGAERGGKHKDWSALYGMVQWMPRLRRWTRMQRGAYAFPPVPAGAGSGARLDQGEEPG